MDHDATIRAFQLTSFIGREREISILHASLSSARLVTLAGPAGCGKTRLAIETLGRLNALFPDGVWFTELASITQASLVVSSVAASLGLPERPGTPLRTTLVGALQHQASLLVFDNCEHLLGPSAEIIEHLLIRCPRLTILATSREPLGVPGEIVMRVLPLSVPASMQGLSIETFMQYDAVRLFVERACAAASGFTVTAENLPAVLQICQQLDGVPLALELAAAWVGTLAPEQISARLEDRFQLLQNGRRVVAPRQRTLRGAMDWSYDLLSDREQRLFNRLSVFAGGCTLESIEGVVVGDGIDRDEALPLLARLVDTSLLMVKARAHHSRYHLLETLRLYAREHLIRGGESDRLHDQHARYFLELSEVAESALWGPELVDWLERLDADQENLRAALRWTVGRGDAETAQRLGAALSRFWRVRGYLTEGLQWLDAALAWSAGSSLPTRARALDAAGHLARDRGDYARAASFYEESLDVRRQLGDVRGSALTTTNLGILAQFRGDYRASEAFHAEGLGIFRSLQDDHGIAFSLVNLAATAHLSGNRRRAKALYEEGIAAFRALNDKRGIAAALNNLGNLASGELDLVAAMQFYEESLALFRELGDLHEVAACLRNLAVVMRDSQREGSAFARCRESLELFQALGDKRGMVECLVFLARIKAERGALEQAARLLGMADALTDEGDIGASSNSAEYAKLTAVVRERMGADRYTVVSTAGRAMAIEEVTYDEAVSAVALGTDPTSHQLTRRQWEVARLIAQGRTNRQIAEALFIAERTVDTHVEHLLARLGFDTRSQIAAWIGDYDSGPHPVETERRVR